MKCEKCGSSDLKCVHTFENGTRAKFAKHKCNKCGSILTEVRFLVDANPERGKGPESLASRVDGDALAEEVAKLLAEADLQGPEE